VSKIYYVGPVGDWAVDGYPGPGWTAVVEGSCALAFGLEVDGVNAPEEIVAY
jgi:hypothetical protein